MTHPQTSSSITETASGIKTLDQLKQLHAHLITHGFASDRCFNLLLFHCVRLRAPLRYAAHLLVSIPRPSPRTFAAAIKLLLRYGARHEVPPLFAQISRFAVGPGASVFPVLIKALGGGAIPIHAHVLKLGHAADPYVRNAIMDMYARFGPIEDAEEMFRVMPERSVVDWNCLLSGYWMWGRKEAALELFDAMPERNVVSWTAMVSGLSRRRELEEAQRFFEQMPERNIVSWNAMLSGYVQNEMPDEALRLFDRMSVTDVRPNETTWVEVITACGMKGDVKLAETLLGPLRQSKAPQNCFMVTALVVMYAKCGSLTKARQVFDQAGDRSLASWNAMIFAYAKEGDLRSARQLFDTMPRKDVVSWNTMVSGYAQNSQWRHAIELFKEMAMAQDLRPDEVTVSTVISACGHLGALEFGRWLVDYIERNGIELGISGHNALIFMYASFGCMEEANSCFRHMSRRDVYSYNSMISGLATNGDGPGALQMLKKMEEERIRPDNVTYLSALTACSHAGLTDEGCRVFESIDNPTVDHYACKVDMLGREGRLDEARRVMEDMPMQPHAGVYGSLLNASLMHQETEVGEYAAEKLFALEPEDSGNYVMLSNIYASAQKWERVDYARTLMMEKSSGRTGGCSWIESDGETHQFTAGDRSHGKADEIYEVLSELGLKMRMPDCGVDV